MGWQYLHIWSTIQRFPWRAGSFVRPAAICAVLAILGWALSDGRNLEAASAPLSKRAILAGADLRGADLQGADLHGANLQEAQLQGVDLSGAIGLTLQQVESAVIDEKTRLPDYLRPPGRGRSTAR